MLRQYRNKRSIAQLDMSKYACPKFLTQKIGHHEAVGHRYLGNLRKVFRDTVYIFSVAVLHCLLPDGEHHKLFSMALCFQRLKQVRVVSPRQSAVTGHYDIAVFLAFGLSGIDGRKICVLLCNILQGLIKPVEVGTAGFRTLLRPAQFGGCHQLHGFGNLHSVLHTFDPQLYRFHIRSHLSPPLYHCCGFEAR